MDGLRQGNVLSSVMISHPVPLLLQIKKSDPSTCRPCSSSSSWSPWWCAPWLSGPITMATTTTDMPRPPTPATTEPQPTTTGGRSRQLLLRTQEK
ncbi:hypothetical protein AVEN_135019-1 [Araneus ventricosus]|uniref:Uncharacterized protein n=1 Tax=Araneus ventricosus TaxID=182803 RepID=A0A4Y2G4L5_ARAVE|nr:hypothetical protein AVEN_135019-1 [Araneus ventricosus]